MEDKTKIITKNIEFSDGLLPIHPFRWGSFRGEISVPINDNEEIVQNTLHLDIGFFGRAWNLPFSVEEFLITMSKLTDEKDRFQVKSWDDNRLSLTVHNATGEKFTEFSETFVPSLRQFFEKIYFSTLQKINKNTLLSLFYFPNEIESAARQYLIYFSTFLKDLGIENTSEIEINATTTLFKISPRNKKQALSKIQQALSIYLQLPLVKNFDVVSNDYPDLAVQELNFTIEKFRAQLSLLNSVVLKQKTQNETLSLLNYQKELDNLNAENSKNEEELLDGVLIVPEFDAKFIRINTPKLLRLLKRIFKKSK